MPASAKFLRKLRDDFGNLGLAAAAYNAGPGRIQKWLARESGLLRETRDYVRIITGTNAEDWTERAEALAIRIDLPREAPCEGIGSLSKIRGRRLGSGGTSTPTVATIIRKAEQLAARSTANRARKRLCILEPEQCLDHGKARRMVARARGRKEREGPRYPYRRARTFLRLGQTGLSSSVTGDVTTINSEIGQGLDFEMACSTPVIPLRRGHPIFIMLYVNLYCDRLLAEETRAPRRRAGLGEGPDRARHDPRYGKRRPHRAGQAPRWWSRHRAIPALGWRSSRLRAATS